MSVQQIYNGIGLSFVCLFTLSACSEYEISSKLDADGRDSGIRTPVDPDTPEIDSCDEFEDPDSSEIPFNTECDVSLSTAGFSPVVEWNWGSQFFCGPAAVAQTVDSNGSGSIDADDIPVLFVYNGGTQGQENGRVHALYGDNSGIAWQSSGTYGQDGGFAIGDLDNDGWPEVVTAGTTKVCALDGQTGSERWCAHGLSASLDPYGYNYPSIADMDGDGNPEVTCGNAIINGQTGVIRGIGSQGKGAAPYEGTGYSGYYGAMSVPIDLDGDGQLELVTGNAAYNADGVTVWSNGGRDGLVAVADFDGDGQGEIVKTSGIYLTGMESDGTEVWGPITLASTGMNTNVGAPAIDDMDGDGTPEFVFAAQNSLKAMEWGGEVLWEAGISDMTGAAGPVLFDFELDGYPEVLYADETSIRFFSGIDGSLKYTSTEHSSYTILETPIVADVDGDDQVEIVLGHCGDGFGATYGAVTVYGDADRSWPPGRKIWNQHAYSITNVDALGEIPSPTVSNWPEYNSFRSGDVGRPPSEYIDLRVEVIDVCEDECGEGVVYAAARPTNAGNVDVPAGVPVSLRAGPGGAILDVQTTSRPTLAGSTGEVLRFEVSAEALTGKRPVFAADEDEFGVGVVFECEETNNAEPWHKRVCE